MPHRQITLLPTPPRAPLQLYYSCLPCTLGSVLIATRSDAPAAANAMPPLAVLYLGDDAAPLADELQRCYPKSQITRDDTGLSALAQAVLAAMADPQLAHAVPLVLGGTAFQQRVWRALCDIPVGKTCSYTDLTAQLGDPKAIRAVARANGANEISVFVPCHRVIGKHGALTGYRWGLARKQALLQLEGATPAPNAHAQLKLL